MKRLVADLLRSRSAWQLLAIAALCTSLALVITYNVYSSTLRQIGGLLVLLYGVAGAALLYAFVRRDQEIADVADRGKAWAVFVGGTLATAGLIAFATYSLGHYSRRMISGCNAARLPDTLPERQAAPGLPDRFDCPGDPVLEGYHTAY